MKEGPTICIWWKKRCIFDWFCLHLSFCHYIQSSKVNSLKENSNVLLYLCVCSYHFLRKCFIFAVKFFLTLIPWFLQHKQGVSNQKWLVTSGCVIQNEFWFICFQNSEMSILYKSWDHFLWLFGLPCTLIWQFCFAFSTNISPDSIVLVTALITNNTLLQLNVIRWTSEFLSATLKLIEYFVDSILTIEILRLKPLMKGRTFKKRY